MTVLASSLRGHTMRQYGKSSPQTREVEIGGGGGITYVVSLPWVLKTVRCPVPGCPEIAHSAGRMREHLMYRNFFVRIAV